MTIKSILVHAQAEAACDRRLRLALTLAETFGASLTGLGAEALGPVFMTGDGMVDGAVIEAARERLASDLPVAEARFRALVGDRPDVSWIAEEAYPDKMLALHARGCDLIVASRPGHGVNAAFAARPVDLVVHAGAPVLLAAESDVAFRGERVIVAWKDTRESRRAVSDALPFLKRAQIVTLIAVSGETEGYDHQAGLTEVAAKLALHGVKAAAEVLPKGKATVTTVLENAATSHSADLIVAGAYGRSRLQEWIMGGVTEDLVAWSSKFVLLSH